MNMKQNRWAHINHKVTPLRPDHTLTNFLAVPASLIGEGLSSTAVLVYTLLLNRGRISQRKGWHDRDGVYVIYTNQSLAMEMGKSVTTIKNAMRQLEGRGLILRRAVVEGEANHIYLRLPPFSAWTEHEQAADSFLPDPDPFSAPK